MKFTNTSSIFILLFIFCVFSPAFAGQEWLSTSGIDKISNPSTTCPVSDPNKIVLNTDLPGISSKTLEIKGLSFTELSIPNEGYSIEIGKPKIPVIRRYIEVPYEAEYSLNIIAAPPDFYPFGKDKLPNTLLPLQPPVPKLPGAKERAQFVKDQSTYEKDSFQYTDLAEVVYEGIWRGRRILLVEIRPVDYNPVKNILSVRNKIEVTVNLEGGNELLTKSKILRYNSSLHNELAAKTLINSETPAIDTDILGYLIITSDAFLEDGHLDRWSAWKMSQGMDVKIASTNQIGTGLKAIRQYIRDAYDTWPIPPSFVLLVGDVNTIPAFTGTGGSNPTSDLYYSTVDGDDYFPDLWLGRISVVNPDQLGRIIDKLMEYQQGRWPVDYPWIQKATFLASEDNYSITEGTHNYVVSTHLEPAGYKSTKLYSHTYQATTGQVYKAINEGCSLLVYSGHGSSSGWGDGPPFYTSDLTNLENEVLPVVWSFACSTNPYDNDECFGEAWLRHIPGGVGFLGSSVSSTWDEDDILEKRLYDGFFNEGLTWIQGMNDYGKMELIRFYGGGGSSQMYTEMYNYMGDPSTDIWTSTPETVISSHSPTCYAGVIHYPVSVEQDGVCVAAISGNQLLGAGISHEGRSLLKFNEPVSGTGSITLSYTGHNVLPASDTLSLETPKGSYIVYRSHRLDDQSGGDGDGIPEAGEYMNLWLTVANVGDEISTECIAKLLGTLDTYLMDSENEIILKSLTPGESTELLEPFVIWIPYDCPDEHTARMEISINSSKTTWLDELEFQTYSAPKIGIEPYNILASLIPDSSSSDVIKVTNLGTSELSFSIKKDYSVSGGGCCDTKGGINFCSPNYSWIDSLSSGGPDYNWVEISDIGTLINETGDDFTAGPFDIGFDFPFYTDTFDQFYVCSNGFISFVDASSPYENSPFPNSTGSGAMLAPYWDDLQVYSPSLFYYNDGSRLIIQFEKIPSRSGSSAYTFEIILIPDGTIYYQYKDIKGSATGGTIGLQNLARNMGVTVSHNTSYLISEMTIELIPPLYWFEVDSIGQSTIPSMMPIKVASTGQDFITFDIPSVTPDLLIGDTLVINGASFEITSNSETQIQVDSKGEDLSSYEIEGTTVAVARHKNINLDFYSFGIPGDVTCQAALIFNSNDEEQSTIPVYIDYFVTGSDVTPTPTQTTLPTSTPTNTETAFITPTWTPDIPTDTPTPNITDTPTLTYTPMPTDTGTAIPTETVTPTETSTSETPTTTITPTSTISADFDNDGIVDATDAFTFS